MNTVLEGGFSDPVLQSQQVFRAVMDALANPGKVQKLTACHSIGRHLTSELVSIMLTFVDHETPLWLGADMHNTTGLLEQVGFLTGANLVDAPEAAAFAFAGNADELPALDRFALGSQEYPDRSTTVVLAVPALEGGPDLTLRGPGIKDHIHCSPQGLMGDFSAQWAANRALFPRGVDLLLVANGAVLGLPRSTRITGGH